MRLFPSDDKLDDSAPPRVYGVAPTPWLDENRPPRIGVFVVAYHAAETIAGVLARIPRETWDCIDEVFIFDDASTDDTCQTAVEHCLTHKLKKVRVFHNQVNLGYGGNQKRGYRYAMEQQFDIVVLLHGDGQYAPEVLGELLKPLVRGEADAVFGSRMLEPGRARQGGMPLYKFVGNKILTTMQNWLLGQKLSEYHSGYRLYNVHALRDLPIVHNANDFHFDNEIIVQLIEGGYQIQEVAIPTYYGDEICRVNGLGYAWNVCKTTLFYRIHKAGLLYFRRFDLQRGHKYTFKSNRYSSHQRILNLLGEADAAGDETVLDVGCGAGYLAAKMAQVGHRVIGVDLYDNEEARRHCERFIVLDADESIGLARDEKANVIVLADVIEHTRDPEALLLRVRKHLADGGRVLASTGNVAHLFIRLSLLLGFFNYTERGILDRTHTRLFTVRTFKQLFRDCGLRITRTRYCPIPFENLIPGWPRLTGLLCWLNMLLVALRPTLFAYQTIVEAVPDPTPSDLLRAQEIERGELEDWLQKSDRAMAA